MAKNIIPQLKGVVTLSSGFMLTSILGFLITVFYIYPSVEKNFPQSTFMNSISFTLMLFFVLMFIASIVSMTYAPIDSKFDIKNEKK